jgi:thiol-disulfide isomerase/thioredoxin
MTFLALAGKVAAVAVRNTPQQLGCKLRVQESTAPMKQFSSTKFAILLMLFMSSVVAQAVPVNVRDAHGAVHRPLEAQGSKAIVMIFVAHDCPISNAYAPEVNRLHRTYAAQGIRFYMVYVDPKLTAAAAKKHAHDFGYKSTVLLDTRKALAKATGATVTPEAVVVLPGGKLLYRGRINDKHVAYGKTRRTATKQDLRDAIDLVLTGKLPKQPIITTAIGCFIPED